MISRINMNTAIYNSRQVGFGNREKVGPAVTKDQCGERPPLSLEERVEMLENKAFYQHSINQALVGALRNIRHSEDPEDNERKAADLDFHASHDTRDALIEHKYD